MSVRTLRYNTATQHFTKSALASTDRDALAFLEAAQIYNANQQRAIVNLVRSLKRVGLWSKMKAIYPFVGGTASSHKWNLKDPRDVDAAFRLTFSGGWTHSSTGADPNGTNAWANTNLAANLPTQDDIHISGYFGDNTTSQAAGAIGTDSGAAASALYPNYLQKIYSGLNTTGGDWLTQDITDSRAMVTAYRTVSTTTKHKRNNETVATKAIASIAQSAAPFIIGAAGFGGTKYYNSTQFRFATIGDGLTDTDASNLYNIVQRYQFQLGRAIEPDAQAFIDAAGITDATQQAAILDLVVRLKNDGLWSKMKAIYPFVGGTATSHMYNLKDPRNADAAFRLSFVGGWTHSSTGALPNASNGYANTFLAPQTSLSLTSHHVSYYSRTDEIGKFVMEFGVSQNSNELPNTALILKFSDGNLYWQSPERGTTRNVFANSVSTGYYVGTRNANNESKIHKNGSLQNTATGTISSTALNTNNLFIAAYNSAFYGVDRYSGKQCAFATIGDGLTDSEASALYNIVDLYQKRLGRAV